VVLASIDDRWVANRLSTGSPASFLPLADGTVNAPFGRAGQREGDAATKRLRARPSSAQGALRRSAS
jgi:hypothetical protein